MPTFESFDGIRLAYETDGEGSVVVLLHGLASTSFIGWVRPGVTDAIVAAGYRTVALDLRGHGGSDKPHEESAYANDAMVRDVQALLDHLGVDRCFCAGYSMGARVTLGLVARDERVRAAVLGGVGSNMMRAREHGNVIADAFLADDRSTITDPTAKSFRAFADLTKADRVALAAVQRADRPAFDGLGAISIPVLVLCGDNDPLVASPQELADAIPGAKAVIVGGTHYNVLNNPEFRRELIAFLDENRSAAA